VDPELPPASLVLDTALGVGGPPVRKAAAGLVGTTKTRRAATATRARVAMVRRNVSLAAWAGIRGVAWSVGKKDRHVVLPTSAWVVRS